MALTGGCYCGEIRYEAAGEPMLRVQCHCRECQYIAGGSPNLVIGMPKDGFTYTKGTPKQFARDDLDSPRIRDFCPNCGTHILTHSPPRPDGVMVKVGTLDDPSVFHKADMAIYTIDQQSFHLIDEDIPTFERVPG
jgi:hypothetical protein